MRIDDGNNWAVTKMFGDQFIASSSGGFNGERVNNDPTGIAFDKRDIGNVVTTNLPHAFGDFEKSVIDIEFGVTPQIGMHSVGCVAFQEVVTTNVAGLTSKCIGDLGVFK